jgi:dynein heavy chain
MILKELHPIVPVVHVTAVLRTSLSPVGNYTCPTYMTSARGATFVFQSYLKMESEETDENIWILAGVALLMQPE